MKVLLSLILLITFADAKTVLISDIDDTIKVSNVLDKTSAIENSNRIDSAFHGMAQLYQAIKITTEAKFYYLSNAPKALMSYYHAQLLAHNQFPNGQLLLRENVFSSTHKIKAIREVVRKENPTLLILIGDNGEHDPEVYAQAVREFPNLRILTFIRQVYSAYLGKDRGTELQSYQAGFVSPMEVAHSLQENYLVTSDQVDTLEKEFVPFAVNQLADQMNGVLAFPGWQDCCDFKIPDSLYKRQTELGIQLLVHIIARCSLPGIDPDKHRR